MESVFYEFETLKLNIMTSERIKEIQQETAYPNSVSVQQVLLKVWNECEQERVKNCSIPAVMQQIEQLKAFLEELIMPDTRNFLYIQNKAKELLKSL